MSDCIIDINADMGESEEDSLSQNELELLSLISSANISCGAHAGHEAIIRETIRKAVWHNVGIGAHPGFPDREGFGRRTMKMEPDRLFETLIEQILFIKRVANEEGAIIKHIKPHGALYNMAAFNPEISEIIINVMAIVGESISLYGLSGSELERLSEERGINFIREVFADRAYNDDMTLVDRSQPGSVIHNPLLCAERAVKMVKENRVVTVTGKEIIIKPQTICIHGDTPEAAVSARLIRERLIEEGVIIKYAVN